jgi:hypothetical protein
MKVGYKTILIRAVVVWVFALSFIFPITNASYLYSETRTLGKNNDFEKSGKMFLANPKSWGPAGKDNNRSYRWLMPGSKAEVMFAEFDVDIDGFCKNDMLLEIHYRDDVGKQLNEKTGVAEKVIVESRIDFLKDNEYFKVGDIRTIGDGRWKSARFFLERTPRQMIRAIGRSFRFRIAMPDKALAVSSMSLVSMNHSDFVKLREQDRADRGLERTEHTSDDSPVIPHQEWLEQGYVVYQVNNLELVFDNSVIHEDMVGRPLQCFEIPGNSEPVTFVIHAYRDLEQVGVTVTDLQGLSGTIPANNIEIRKVENSDQRWSGRTYKYYGTCPDHLGFRNPRTDIDVETKCQFWLTIKVPKAAIAGKYNGKITIKSNASIIGQVPLSIDVLDVKLLGNEIRHIIAHSPFLYHFHRDQLNIFRDMKEHGVVPIFYPPIRFVRGSRQMEVDLGLFENQLKLFRKADPETRELFVVLFNYNKVWRDLGGGNPKFTKPHKQFQTIYARILKQYAEVARRCGLELYFSFNGEPFRDVERRRSSYLCSQIAQKNGLKTWSSHNYKDDIQLALTPREISEGINYLRPLKEVLNVFMEATLRIDEDVIKGVKKSDCEMSYYTTYMATNIRPAYNRFLHGIYPFVVNSKYVGSYAYGHSMGDPYDDLDGRAKDPISGVSDYILTYPTWKGDILPTLSYEALREGVEDSHLISTFRALIKSALNSKDSEVIKIGQESQEYLNEIFQRVRRNFNQEYWHLYDSKPTDRMEKKILLDLNNGKSTDYAVFDEIRKGVCDKIISLQNATARRDINR